MGLIKKIIKMIVYSILGLIGLFVLIGFIFVKFSPQFGAGSSNEQKDAYAKTGHFEDGVFVNQIPSEMNINYIKGIREYFKKDPTREPKLDIEVKHIDSTEIINYVAVKPRLTWFGHSSFLLEIDQLNILLDPMLGETPAPHPLLGNKRYSKELPIEIEQLPFIDAVIFSHDHYDHLDYETIMKIKDKVGKFYVPLGVGNHLISWGVPEENVYQLDWWEEIKFRHITLVCTPSRHFSGRGLTDRAKTLWSSWVIKTISSSVYFSGDSGYGPHFKEIGDKYGPFDIGLMECGQYNEDWHAIHMMPEETVQAGLDIKAKRIVPIHWGAFTLSLHSWTDPIERVIAKAEELNVQVVSPEIGQSFDIDGIGATLEKWWERY